MGQAAQHARDLEGEGGSLQADIQALEGRNAKLKEELARTQRERDQLLHRCNDAKKVGLICSFHEESGLDADWGLGKRPMVEGLGGFIGRLTCCMSWHPQAINKLEHLVEQHRLNEPRLQEELRRLKDNYEALAKVGSAQRCCLTPQSAPA